MPSLRKYTNQIRHLTNERARSVTCNLFAFHHNDIALLTYVTFLPLYCIDTLFARSSSFRIHFCWSNQCWNIRENISREFQNSLTTNDGHFSAAHEKFAPSTLRQKIKRNWDCVNCNESVTAKQNTFALWDFYVIFSDETVQLKCFFYIFPSQKIEFCHEVTHYV